MGRKNRNAGRVKRIEGRIRDGKQAHKKRGGKRQKRWTDHDVRDGRYDGR